MPRGHTFSSVEAIGRTLPDVELTHYLNYPCVLVRLGRVHADALRDLVTGAHRFISAKTRKRSAGPGRPSGGRRRAR